MPICTHFFFFFNGDPSGPHMEQGGPLGPCSINGVGRAPTPYGHPKGAHYRSRFVFFSLVARPLAFGSLPAPMGTLKGAHMHTRRVCIISRDLFIRVCECPSGNFGQNYRDLGVNLRAPFWTKLPGSFGPSIPCGDIPSGFKTHYRGPDIPCFLI